MTLGSSQVSFTGVNSPQQEDLIKYHAHPRIKGMRMTEASTLRDIRHISPASAGTPLTRLGWDPVGDGPQGGPQPAGPGEEVRSRNPPSPGRTGTADLVIHKEEFTSPHVLLWENCSTGPPELLE